MGLLNNQISELSKVTKEYAPTPGGSFVGLIDTYLDLRAQVEEKLPDEGRKLPKITRATSWIDVVVAVHQMKALSDWYTLDGHIPIPKSSRRIRSVRGGMI